MKHHAEPFCLQTERAIAPAVPKPIGPRPPGPKVNGCPRPIGEMSDNEIEEEIWKLKLRPYNSRAKWAGRLFELRRALEDGRRARGEGRGASRINENSDTDKEAA